MSHAGGDGLPLEFGALGINKWVNMSENKCVPVVNESMPLGVIANTAAVLSASLGKLRPEMIGVDLPDGDGYTHQGITTMAIPILKGNGPLLKRLRTQAKEFEPGLLVVDLIGVPPGPPSPTKNMPPSSGGRRETRSNISAWAYSAKKRPSAA